MPPFHLKDRMTLSERMTALFAGNPIDRVPFNPFAIGFAASVSGIDRGVMYRKPEKAFEAGRYLMAAYPWMNTRPAYGWADRGPWEFGGRVYWPDNNRYPAPASRPLVTNPSEIEELPAPDPATAGMNPLIDRFNTICRRHGFPASLPGGTPTTLSAGITGQDRFLKWLYKRPDEIHSLQKKTTHFIIRTAAMTLQKYGPENCTLFCGVPMESKQLMPPDIFKTFAKPYIREILTFYRKSGLTGMVLHLCGDHLQNLHHFLGLPLPDRTIFSIGTEMDLADTSRAIGKKHILAGNISTSILHKGTPQDVSRETDRCLSDGMAHPGGFILMPACELPPDTPPENIEALAETLFENGYY